MPKLSLPSILKPKEPFYRKKDKADNGTPAGKPAALFGRPKKGKGKQESSLEAMETRLNEIAVTKQQLRSNYDKLHADYIALQLRYGMFDPETDMQEAQLNAIFQAMALDDHPHDAIPA